MKSKVLIMILIGVFVGCSSPAKEAQPGIYIHEDLSSDMEEMTDMEDMSRQTWKMPVIEGWPTAEDTNPDENIVEVKLVAKNTVLDIGTGKLLSMMTYNGSFPGPLIQAKVGDRVIVHFENQTTEKTTIHWHGLRISDQMDGNPRLQSPVEPGQSFTYDFVVPEAGTFWYHPHVRANEQVERGLYGGFIVHDPEDPVVDAERLLIVDDILLQGDQIAPFLAHHMEFVHGRTGNQLLVNGQVNWPIEVSSNASTERWRIVNTSNARTFKLSVSDRGTFKVIATDGGLLERPYMTPRIEVAVGQRYDLEINHDGQTSPTLTAHVLTRDDQGSIVEAPFPFYKVTSPTTTNPTSHDWARPKNLGTTPDRRVTFTFDGYNGEDGRTVWTINDKANNPDPLFTFKKGEIVEMTIDNKQGPEHPFHLHGQFFTILDDGNGNVQFGLRDTVLVPGRKTVKILAYMDNPGKWMAHCHILEHAELGMMSEIVIDP